MTKTQMEASLGIQGHSSGRLASRPVRHGVVPLTRVVLGVFELARHSILRTLLVRDVAVLVGPWLGL